MHYFITEISQQDVGNVKSFLRQAQTIYDENLNAYIKLVLRRPLAKILVSDSFQLWMNLILWLIDSPHRTILMELSGSCRQPVHQKYQAIAPTISLLSSAL